MITALFASLRLAIAIVCIGLSLVFAILWLDLFDQPLRMTAFFVVAGTAVYWVFVLFFLRGFEVSQVIPDRVREALDTLSEGLLVMDEQNRIVLANSAFCQMVNMDRDKLLGSDANSLSWICSEFAGCDDFPWQRAMRLDRPQVEQLLRFRMVDQSVRLFAINASSVHRNVAKLRGALTTFRDVTQSEEHRAQREQALAMLQHSRDEIRSQNRQLQILASMDGLTECLNRRAFSEAFDEVWETFQKTGEPISCLMIDNDHFKHVNDRYGHPVGDEVLRNVSSILRAQFREPALVCRYGGEEFCIVLPNVPLESAVEAAETARESIEASKIVQSPKLRLTASIGVSETRFGAPNPPTLIAQADECLYIAKNSGRNRVVANEG